MNFARTIYSGHAVLPRVRFHGAYDARLHDASFYRSPIYHIALSDASNTAAAAPHIRYLIEYYLQARVQVGTCGSLIRVALKRGAGTPDIN